MRSCRRPSETAARPGGWIGVSVAVLCALALGGCGHAYSRQDFTAQASGVCTNTLDALRALPAPASTGTEAGLAAYLGRAVPLEQRELRQLRALRRPPGTARQRAQITDYLQAKAAAVDNLAAIEQLARRGNASSVAATEQALSVNAAPRLATAIGMPACGSPGATIGR